MAKVNPFTKQAASMVKGAMPAKKAGKAKPVSAKQAALLASFTKGKKAAPPVMPMDAEDMVDGGIDEKTEKS